ncbi:MAG TPA: hypothetical protein VHX66_17450 [Solirubrobacteraceae bacterium]|nr:hypothetical protein [Solirubrobacteraceae bacterium]
MSVALIAIALTNPMTFRLASLVLLALVIAAGAFIATVECTFMARQFAVTPGQLEEWNPDADHPGRRKGLRREQRYYVARFRTWARRARVAYNVGIVALGVGIVLALVPQGHVTDGRIAVIAVAGLMLTAEVAWVIVTIAHQPVPELPEVSDEPPSGSS